MFSPDKNSFGASCFKTIYPLLSLNKFFINVHQNGERIRFDKISGMFSELIGIGTDGKLYQWKWSSDASFSMPITIDATHPPHHPQQRPGQILIHHPKTLFLQLLNEKICGLSTSTIRASCWTESGKVRTKKTRN